MLYERLEAQEQGLRARAEELGLTDTEISDILADWFTENEGAKSIVDMVKEHVRLARSAPPDREVIITVTPRMLQRWGIFKGPLWEEAPWRLIRLHASDLRREGALMRHCVGKTDMGYLQSVEKGAVEIWSLRSKSGKPRFTLEVEPGIFDLDPEERKDAILQLKGKANRTPGYADKKQEKIAFPEEVVLWDALFEEMGIVHPEGVEDFPALRYWLAREMRLPDPRQLAFRLNGRRRVSRSFNLPHRSR